MFLCRLLLLRFQFHKGTIKTVLLVVLSLFLVHFNSIKVQLRLSVCKSIQIVKLDFNSIKVQLRHVCRKRFQSKSKFQFHKGTIKTHCFGIYNILVSNRIWECKVKKSYWKNVDGWLYIFMRSATTIVFLWCYNKSKI